MYLSSTSLVDRHFRLGLVLPWLVDEHLTDCPVVGSCVVIMVPNPG